MFILPESIVIFSVSPCRIFILLIENEEKLMTFQDASNIFHPTLDYRIVNWIFPPRRKDATARAKVTAGIISIFHRMLQCLSEVSTYDANWQFWVILLSYARNSMVYSCVYYRTPIFNEEKNLNSFRHVLTCTSYELTLQQLYKQ